MYPVIENRSYSYGGLDICNITATLNIYEDDTKAVLIDSCGLSASYNINQADFVTEITRQLTVTITEYMEKLAALDAQRLVLMPTSTSFSDAVDLILDPIETSIQS